jgi:hypothetical protein
MTYCERIDLTFWAEPVNAVTNLSFVVAALAIAHALSRSGHAVGKVWDLWLLTGLIAAIGVGSFLWHTLARPWAAVTDVVPILLFINVYLLSFLVRIVKPRPRAVAGWFITFQLVNVGLLQAVPADAFNGSVFYLPTWAALWLMAVYCWRNDSGGGQAMLAAGLAFTLSLTLRTIDIDLCRAWPLGTHFAWHLLNGLVLYLVTMALITAHRHQRF